jgi:hypothetical protein
LLWAIYIWFGGHDGEATITVHGIGVVIQVDGSRAIFQRFFRAEQAGRGPTLDDEQGVARLFCRIAGRCGSERPR